MYYIYSSFHLLYRCLWVAIFVASRSPTAVQLCLIKAEVLVSMVSVVHQQNLKSQVALAVENPFLDVHFASLIWEHLFLAVLVWHHSMIYFLSWNCSYVTDLLLSIEVIQSWVYIITKSKPLCWLKGFVFPGIYFYLFIYLFIYFKFFWGGREFSVIFIFIFLIFIYLW